MSNATTNRTPPKLCINCHHHKSGSCYREFEQVLSLVDGKTVLYLPMEYHPNEIYDCEAERHKPNGDHKVCGVDGIFWRKHEEPR